MSWSTIDWPAVVGALIALWNAIQHKTGQAKQAAAHKETVDILTGEVPKS